MDATHEIESLSFRHSSNATCFVFSRTVRRDHVVYSFLFPCPFSVAYLTKESYPPPQAFERTTRSAWFRSHQSRVLRKQRVKTWDGNPNDSIWERTRTDPCLLPRRANDRSSHRSVCSRRVYCKSVRECRTLTHVPWRKAC